MNNTALSNPWPGLGSYDETGRYKFCGRNRATNELYSLISNNSIISLFGRSGIGKTSLLKAGVSPLLARKGFLPVYVRLSQEEKVPDDNVGTLSYAECIVRCLEKKMEENGFIKSEASWKIVASDNTDFLWSYFCKTAFQSSDDAHCTPVIILDQFEEIFLDRREDAAMLMRQLYVLVNGSRRLPEDLDYDAFRNRFRFVMSFRDDSLYRLEDVINEYNLASFKENRYLLKALSRDDAMDVVTEPGEDLFDADVVNRILDKVVAMGEGSSVDPAILSLLMYGLYERMIQKGDASIQGALVDEAGNDIVRDFYERRMSGIGLSARKYLEEHLVSSDGRRRSVAAADACSHVKVEELESLTDKHILTKLERGSFSDYELTHDVLCPIVVSSRAETDAKAKIAKNKRMASILSAIVAVVLAIVAVFFFQNKHLKEERWKALGNQSRFVAEKALQLAEEGDAYLAKLLLINTIPSNLDKPERPLTAESASALAHLFNNESGILKGHTSVVYSATYSPDGRSIVTASSDKTVRIWDVTTGYCLKVLEGHTDDVYSAAYSPNGRSIVSASGDKNVRIWDATTGYCLKVLEGHTDDVYSAAYSPNGRSIVSASDDGTVRIWDATTGTCLKVLEGHTSWVLSATYSPDGRSIVSASCDGTVRIWDATTGACQKVLEGNTYGVMSATYSPDGRNIVSASGDGTVRIWDATTGYCLKVLEGHPDGVRSATYSPDGRSIVSASGDGVRIWDATTKVCLKVLKGHTDWVYSAAYSPDGRSIVSASGDKNVRIWDATTGYCLKVLEGHTDDVYSAAYSPNGRSIVSASGDKTVRIWDATTGYCLKVLEGHTNGVRSAAYSPDGRGIVSASSDGVRIWNATTGACLKVLEGHTDCVMSATYSPDGRSIVSTSLDGTVRIWDATTGYCLKVLEGHTDGVRSAAYNPDGRSIVSASLDGTVRIWDATTGVCQKVLEVHTNNVTSATYSPDGRSIVSASDDLVRIWDATTGICLKVLKGITASVNYATYSFNGSNFVRINDPQLVYSTTYSPDGKNIVSASLDGTVRIWTAPPSLQDMIKTTRERFKNRQLTPEEKHRYYLD